MIIPKKILEIRKVASDDPTRGAIHAVKLDQHDKQTHAIATDGKILIKASWENIDESDYPVVPGAHEIPNPLPAGLLPLQVAAAIQKSIKAKKSYLPILNTAKITFSVSAEGTLNGRAITTDLETPVVMPFICDIGQFPNYEQVMGAEKSIIREIIFSVETLKKLVSALEGMDIPGFTLGITANEGGPMRITASGEGLEIVGALMPGKKPK